MSLRSLASALIAATLATASASAQDAPTCKIELVVLGAGQDAGAPQIGNADDTGPRLLPSSLSLIDRESGKRFLFDATPAITEQLTLLDRIEPPKEGLGVDGVFLTHAHIGHYLGLAYFGREAAGASGVPVHAMPRMEAFLRGNGPWSQLVELGNIDLVPLQIEALARASQGVGVLPITVPHRDEYSETVGFQIMTARKRVLYVPDLDSWDEYAELSGQPLEDLLLGIDLAFIDATFWDDNELGGRDMSAIPHPRVLAVMERLQRLPAAVRGRVHFIHYNHTNPIRDPESEESAEVRERGFNIARRGHRHCLVPGK